MERRTLLASLSTSAVIGVSGCLGLVGLDYHESSPAGVEATVREDTGYSSTGTDELIVEELVSIGPISETVVAVNYLTEYEKAIDLGPLGSHRAAIFLVLSTPKISVLGREFNPVESMDSTDIVALIEQSYDDIDDINHLDDEELEILGQATTVSKFSAAAVFDGIEFDVNMHVSQAIETDEDFIIGIGVYPRELAGNEEDNVRRLMQSITSTYDGDNNTRIDNSDGNSIDDGLNSDDNSGDDETTSDDTIEDDDSSNDGSDDDILPLKI